MRHGLSVAVLLAACRTPPAAPPPTDGEAALLSGPVRAEPDPSALAPAESSPAPEPEPVDPLAGMDAEQRWQWGIEALPALAGHARVDPTPTPWATMRAWFADGKPHMLWIRRHDEADCMKVEDVVSGETEVTGKAHRNVELDHGVRRETWTGVSIAPWGIALLGDGGTESKRDARGRWQEIGGFGVGSYSSVTHQGITEADQSRAVFRSYSYTLTAECWGIDEAKQICVGGGERTCPRCMRIYLHPHATGRGWGHGSMPRVGHSLQPVDCTQPCPPDEVTPKIEPLNRALAGVTFYGQDDDGVLVYRSGKTCRADARNVGSP